MASTVSQRSTVVAAKDQVSSDLGGEKAILDLKAGKYYGLDGVGARVWDLIQEPRAVGDIRNALLEEYEVAPERCEHDLLALLQRLADEGLIEVRHARLGRFYRLPASERWLLAKAALLLGAIRVGLWLFPFRTLRSLLDRAAVFHRAGETDCQSTDVVVWAIEVAAKYMPAFDTCLTKALAAQVLLSRRGCPALLRIGVVKSAEGKFEAHAWVESDGRVVIGGYELERYTPLAALEGEAS